MSYYQKYIKYKNKYLNLKGGVKDYSHTLTGISLAYFDKNKILEQIATGYRKLDEETKIQIQDKFPIASISKSMLCEAITNYDKTLWDKPIFDLLKSILDTNKIHPDWLKHTDLKLYNIGNHTAGLPDDHTYIDKNYLVKDEFIKLEQELKKFAYKIFKSMNIIYLSKYIIYNIYNICHIIKNISNIKINI